ncbi:glucosaminidase domain-containing protein [Planktomarina temperata]|nr:glucosaminidase domain-containing protein [Planktomarina temperata]
MDTGLMQPQPNRTTTTSSPLLEQFRAVLSPTGGSPRTLEEKLAALSDTELQSIMQTAKFVQMAMQFKLAANDKTMGWPELVQSMYRGMGIDRRSLIAELLEETDPLPFIPEPKAQRSSQERGQAIYDRPEFNIAPVTEPTADDQAASALESVLADTFPEPQSSKVAEGKEAFLAAYTPVAKEIAEDLGVSYKVVLAQAALESGWGKSVKGNNLMGIKSHGEEGGVDIFTHEVVNGKRVKLTDSFRQYDSPEDSIRGYGKFLKANSRYKHFLRAGAENEDAQLSALQTSGYATDPKYSFKLRTIMNGLPDDEEGQG